MTYVIHRTLSRKRANSENSVGSRQWSPERVHRMEQLLSVGMSAVDIAVRLDVSDRTIYRWKRQLKA